MASGALVDPEQQYTSVAQPGEVFRKQQKWTKPLLIVSVAALGGVAVLVAQGRYWKTQAARVSGLPEFSEKDVMPANLLGENAIGWTAMHPDPAVLKWLTPSEVKPGGSTCGFLTAPLGTMGAHLESYPDVKVYFCIKFAKTQPAPKGTIFSHCGGPGTLSGCGVSYGFIAGDDYNHIGIDQRGLGRSLPTFATPNCTIPGYSFLNDDESEAETRDLLRKVAARAQACFNDPSFQLPAKNKKSGQEYFNFLQYSGTDDLAEDLDRFRKAIGAPKLSLHGVSYGTLVAMMYATKFKDHVDKFVLNSPVRPIIDMFKIGWDGAQGNQLQYDNFANACDSAGEACPLSKADGGSGNALAIVMGKMRQLNIQVPLTKDQCEAFMCTTPSPPSVSAILVMNVKLGLGQKGNRGGFKSLVDEVYPLYEAATSGDAIKFESMVIKSAKDYVEKWIAVRTPAAGSKPSGSKPSGSQGPPTLPIVGENPDTWSEPTDHLVAGQPAYHVLINQGQVAQTCVMSQSSFDAATNENYFINRWKEVLATFPNFHLGKSAKIFTDWWTMTYAWPRLTPVSSAASPVTPGMIIGYVFDPNTPYAWAQQAHEAFPMTSLVTSQASKHGMNGEAVDKECVPILQAYLQEDKQPVDGDLCRAPQPISWS